MSITAFLIRKKKNKLKRKTIKRSRADISPARFFPAFKLVSWVKQLEEGQAAVSTMAPLRLGGLTISHPVGSQALTYLGLH